MTRSAIEKATTAFCGDMNYTVQQAVKEAFDRPDMHALLRGGSGWWIEDADTDRPTLRVRSEKDGWVAALSLDTASDSRGNFTYMRVLAARLRPYRAKPSVNYDVAAAQLAEFFRDTCYDRRAVPWWERG